MSINYKKEAIANLAAEIMAAGFRVFIAERGTYGFYTDDEGSRVVSFQYDLGGFKFSGNYKTDQPKSTGTGWELEPNNFVVMFNQVAPSWAVGRANWDYTTLSDHLGRYQWSSRYVEQQKDNV